MQPISQLRVTLGTNYQVQQFSSYGLAVMYNYIHADIFRIFLKPTSVIPRKKFGPQ